MDKLFETDVIAFAGLTAFVVLLTLIVVGIVQRRVRYLMSEVESLRREVKLVDEALQMVNSSLAAREPIRPRRNDVEELLATHKGKPVPPEPSAKKPAKTEESA